MIGAISISNEFYKLISPDPNSRPATNTEIETYRLSREFQSYVSTEVMGDKELALKSAVALTLGFIPFIVTKISMEVFKELAETVIFCREHDYLKPFGVVMAVPTVLSAATMLLSTKIFALSQTIPWGDYVKHPSGDGPNTRIAQYGASSLPWQDFKRIVAAIFTPQQLTSNDWSLKEWSKVVI